MSLAIIIVAGGSGTRLGADLPKAFVPVAGTSLLARSAATALQVDDLGRLVVVAPADHLDQARAELPADARVVVVPGGAERTDSVAAGLAALDAHDGASDVVLVHDCARALTPVGLFERVAQAVREGAPAVVPGLAVVDTIKQVDAAGSVVATPERSTLRAVQTPQGFARDVLERAHAASGAATDDAALVEALGLPVQVVDGDEQAFKVTTQEDLARARRLVAARETGGTEHAGDDA